MRRGEFGESNSRRVSFDQGWSDYKNGFGDLEGEFWLGNEFIHQLTAHANDDVMLQVDLESFDGDHVSIVFDTFKIEEETNNYRLHVRQTRRDVKNNFEKSKQQSFVCIRSLSSNF